MRGELSKEAAQIDISLLPIVKMYPIKDAKILIKKLDYYPPIDCTTDNCYELAEFLVFLVQNNGFHMTSFACSEHKERLEELCKNGTPVEIVN